MGALKPGDFVEFRAILRRNPLVEAVQSMKEALDFAAPFAPGQTGPKAQRQPEVPVKKMMALLDALTEGSSLELVGELLDVTGVRAVLSTRLEYFSDRNAGRIVAARRGVLFLHAAGVHDQSALELGLSAHLGWISARADARPV